MQFIRPVLFALFLVLTGNLTAHAQFYRVTNARELVEEFPVMSGLTLEVANDAGAIHVKGIDGGMMKLRASYDGKNPATLRVFYEEGKLGVAVSYPQGSGGTAGNVTMRNGGISISNVSGGSISIVNGVVKVNGKVVTPGNGGDVPEVGTVKLTLEVPNALLKKLTARAASAEIRVEQLAPSPNMSDREVDLRASSGDVTVKNVYAPGGIRVATSSGEVMAQTNQGRLAIGTSSGDVVADRNIGGIEVVTSSGDSLIAGQQGKVSVRSSSGDIKLNNPEALGEEFETRSGDVIRKAIPAYCQKKLTER